MHLEHPRGAHAAADAHAHDTVAAAAAGQLGDEADGQFGAGAPSGWPSANGAAIDVDFTLVDTQRG